MSDIYKPLMSLYGNYKEQNSSKTIRGLRVRVEDLKVRANLMLMLIKVIVMLLSYCPPKTFTTVEDIL